MDIDFKNKKAIVCGSTQGIGKATALGLASLGASITLIARNEDSLKKTLLELDKNHGQTHDYVVADFSKPDELEERINTYLKNINQIHILINNTGGPAGGSILSAKREEFTQTFSSHLICNHILVQAVAPLMKPFQEGRIINVISTSVKEPLENLGVSNTIRWAVASWAKTLAGELGEYGITVNNVLPGYTKTARLEAILKNKMEQTGQNIDKLEEKMKQGVPLKRFASAEEVANAVIFLASPAASYITGINLPVDGGRTKSL